MSGSMSAIYETTTTAVAYAEKQQQPGQPVIPATNNQEWIDKQSNTEVSFLVSQKYLSWINLWN